MAPLRQRAGTRLVAPRGPLRGECQALTPELWDGEGWATGEQGCGIPSRSLSAGSPAEQSQSGSAPGRRPGRLSRKPGGWPFSMVPPNQTRLLLPHRLFPMAAHPKLTITSLRTVTTLYFL